MSPVSSGDQLLVRRLLIVALLGFVLVVAWTLSDLLLLLFAAVLVGIVLHTIADLMRRVVPLHVSVAVLLAAALVAGVVGAIVWLFGSQIAGQAQLLAKSLPEAVRRITGTGAGALLDMLTSNGAMPGVGTIVSRAFSWSTTLIGAVASLVIVIFGGVYLAIDPQLYRDGAMKLVPQAAQAHVSATLDDSGDALRRWIAAQLAAVGVIFGPIGLLLGFPLLVVLDTAIRRLYVLDVLGKPVEILGEPATQSTEQASAPHEQPPS